ncbi:hypothetical protein ACIQWR_26120 [Streptomyces sp. NPDC098789]|uniref:hypothetical protein n=1 Tax=Streptomyces sp. NPDC098789 TaxID=3366098 RepID=UPI003812969E
MHELFEEGKGDRALIAKAGGMQAYRSGCDGACFHLVQQERFACSRAPFQEDDATALSGPFDDLIGIGQNPAAFHSHPTIPFSCEEQHGTERTRPAGQAASGPAVIESTSGPVGRRGAGIDIPPLS